MVRYATRKTVTYLFTFASQDLLNGFKEILVCYNVALYNLTHVSYKIITYFNTHYFFHSKPSLFWDTYITNLPKHNKTRYKDSLMVDRDWEGDILEIRVRNIPSFDLRCDNDV
ncbi:hypothetical protein DVH24_040158 [Malus domestica]|uniref:Uncharacterized protein n=1 Tax=Malus domestica TaxID=3750 RepID=A0A498ING9_MALDO|nr:hypothetical protein DVH24_040158 [Malus domestica]